MPATQKIEVEGVAKSLKILRALEPELAKEVRSQLKASVKPVVAEAKRNLPAQALSKWGPWTTRRGRDLGYNGTVAKRGVVITQQTAAKRTKRGGYQPIALLELRNQSPAGAVFELAGAKNGAGVFNRNLAAKHGPPKRVLYKAWDQRGGQVDADIEDAVHRIEREITSRLARP